MIDHISVGVDDIESAKKFYDTILEKLEYYLIAEMDGLLAYGKNGIQFLAMKPYDGDSASAGNGMHVAFKAATSEQVDEFHRAAMQAGAMCEGAPGARAYPHAEVYAAYVRDPFGHKLEALTNGFAA